MTNVRWRTGSSWPPLPVVCLRAGRKLTSMNWICSPIPLPWIGRFPKPWISSPLNGWIEMMSRRPCMWRMHLPSHGQVHQMAGNTAATTMRAIRHLSSPAWSISIARLRPRWLPRLWLCWTNQKRVDFEDLKHSKQTVNAYISFYLYMWSTYIYIHPYIHML